MSTPETDKPRVQLEKMTPPSSQIQKKQLQPNPDTQNLELLKQTVAQLEGGNGTPSTEIGNATSSIDGDETSQEIVASKNTLQSYESTFQ